MSLFEYLNFCDRALFLGGVHRKFLLDDRKTMQSLWRSICVKISEPPYTTKSVICILCEGGFKSDYTIGELIRRIINRKYCVTVSVYC